MMRNLLQTTLQEFSYKELTDDITGKKKSAWNGKKLIIKSVGDGSLLGIITRIDEYGLVSIRFNKDVLKVENITQIDKTVLNVTAISSYYPNDQRELAITYWNATFMSTKDLKIQLYFKSPL